jgi:hypothetical protein
MLLPAVLLVISSSLHAAEPASQDWLEGAGRPAFSAAENVADGVYGFVRVNVVGTLLPNSLAAHLDASPQGDSYAAFVSEFSSRQLRAAKRDWYTHPQPGGSVEAWLGDAAAAHRNAALDALAATMADRYRLRRFGQMSGDDLRDPDNWDADVLTPAAIFGGTYAYLAGLRADFVTGPLAVGLDIAPGASLEAAAAGTSRRRLARLEVGPHGSPFTVYAEVNATSVSDRVGASWTSRF